MCPGEGFLNDNLASPAVIPVPCGCEAVSLDEIPVDVHRCHLMCCEQRAPWSEGYDWMPHTILTPQKLSEYTSALQLTCCKCTNSTEGK